MTTIENHFICLKNWEIKLGAEKKKSSELKEMVYVRIKVM